MAVSATTNTVGGQNFFTVGTAGADGVKSTFGVPEGFAVISDPANKQDIIVAGRPDMSGRLRRCLRGAHPTAAGDRRERGH